MIPWPRIGFRVHSSCVVATESTVLRSTCLTLRVCPLSAVTISQRLLLHRPRGYFSATKGYPPQPRSRPRRLFTASHAPLAKASSSPKVAPDRTFNELRRQSSAHKAKFIIAISALLLAAGTIYSGLSHRLKEGDHTTLEDLFDIYTTDAYTKADTDADADTDTDAMASSTDMLPGRPGNLTPEQDEQLRKMWARIAEICAVADEDGAGSGAATPEATTAKDRKQSELDGDKGKKKSRLGFLSRKGKKDAADKSESVSSSSSKTDLLNQGGSDQNDKYGQTKIFLDTLASMSPEVIRATIWSMVKHDHPDALVLRFLRARKWDVEKALVMMISSMSWRAQDAGVDSDIMVRGEAGYLADEQSADGLQGEIGKGVMDQLRLGKSMVHGHDKLGRPICLVRVRLHRSGEQCEQSLEKYTIYLIETARFMLKPPIDTATLIFDMTGFTLANMDYAPVKFIIKCFEANFPESLGVVLVHKAPWVFQGVWRIIRGWLDPVVASKIHFTNNLTDIQEFIAPEHLPKELDGSEDWEYRYVEPIPGENDKMKDTTTRDRLLAERDALYKQFEDATFQMIRDPPDQTVRKAREDVAARLRTQYWQLDPYIRARSWYDRTGVLKPGGVVDYYPAASAAAASGGAATSSSAPAALGDVNNQISQLALDGIAPSGSSQSSTTDEKVATEVAGATPQPVNGVA